MAPEKLIEAAGGVLWRPVVGGAGIEVALVHRPKYDDWSLPKGKLGSGEHPVLGALREVQEETGCTGVPGRPIGETRYLKEGAPKRVRYWAMRLAAGEFAPNPEVDQLMWLPPREAQAHLLPERDRGVLDGVDHTMVQTWACALVRHGSAGERSSWKADDRERPLDELGERQADALVPLLTAYEVRRVLSADVVRCLETIMPFAARARLTVENEPLLSEAGYADHPGLALDRLLDIAGSGVPSVVCSQGKVLPSLLTAASKELSGPYLEESGIRKGTVVVVHLRRSERLELVAVERFDPLAA